MKGFLKGGDQWQVFKGRKLWIGKHNVAVYPHILCQTQNFFLLYLLDAGGLGRKSGEQDLTAFVVAAESISPLPAAPGAPGPQAGDTHT